MKLHHFRSDLVWNAAQLMVLSVDQLDHKESFLLFFMANEFRYKGQRDLFYINIYFFLFFPKVMVCQILVRYGYVPCAMGIVMLDFWWMFNCLSQNKRRS